MSLTITPIAPPSRGQSTPRLPDQATLRNLLDSIRDCLSAEPDRTQKQVAKRMSDFVTTANHICRFLNKSVDHAFIGEIVDIGPDFSLYLSDLGVSRGTACQLSAHRNTLLRYAKEFGSAPATFALADEWKPILDAGNGLCGGASIVRYAVKKRLHMADFTQGDLDTWAKEKQDQGRSCVYINDAQSGFLRILQKGGFAARFPRLTFGSREPYAYCVPISEMPDPLSRDIALVLAWVDTESRRKTGRPSRLVTVFELRKDFEQLYGYTTNVLGMQGVESLGHLLTEELIRNFVQWQFVSRRCKRTTIVGRLSRIYSAIKKHPSFGRCDYGWILRVLTELPKEPPSALEERRRRNEVDYDDLKAIPLTIRSERIASNHLSPISEAWLVHDELLITWLVTLPWYPRCIRECRIGSASGNVFEASISENVFPSEIPAWIHSASKMNGQRDFWQFHFRASETPVDHAVHGYIPRRLLPLLSEYLSQYRLLLIGAEDPGTLFINRTGGPLSSSQLGQLVATITRHYAGRQVTPSAVRAIFAYNWLATHPDDFASLSRILWIDLPTAIRRFGPLNFRGHIDNNQHRRERA